MERMREEEKGDVVRQVEECERVLGVCVVVRARTDGEWCDEV